jgi:PPM family protein phosphatase
MTDVHALSPGISLEVASQTDRGLERDDNQDTALVALLPGALVAAVCDGMGGAAGGQLASSRAASAIDAHVRACALTGEASVARALFDAVEAATHEVFALATADKRLSGMGTTATVAGLAGDRLVVAQIGDSRAYLFRRGVLTQVTRDQTLAQLMLERGQLAPHEVATFPHANVILQAVGTAEHVEVDLRSVRLAQGDVVLLCSDGLHGPVGDTRLAETLAEASSLERACDALVGQALAVGGPDNVTCVLVRVRGDGLAVATSGEVDVTRCVLPQMPEATPEAPPASPKVSEKAPLSHLWPLRWGPWASKKTP